MWNENEGTVRRRRNSITIAILQRRHVIPSNCFLYSDDDGVVLLDNVDRDSWILGFKDEAASTPNPCEFTALCTSQSTPNIFNSSSRFIQVLNQLNIIGAQKVIIGPLIKIDYQAVESEPTCSMDETDLIRSVREAASYTTQYINELTIINADTVQREPVVEITRRQTEEVLSAIEGGIPPTELESQPTKPKKQKKIRCGVAVLLGCSIVIGLGIMIHIAIKLSNVDCATCDNAISYVIQLRITEWWYKTRFAWNAEAPLARTFLNTPIYFVVVGHSVINYCEDETSCMENIRAMQWRDRIEKKRHDIEPNFIITPNGLVFEGRGANVQGAMLPEYNRFTISILFLGDYERNQTCTEQFDNLKRVLYELQEEHVLAKNYRLLGECQTAEMPLSSPGLNIMNELRLLEYWYSDKIEHCPGSSNKIVDFITQNMDG